MQINLQGVGIGNGWVNPAVQYSSDADLLYENFLIPEPARIAYNDVAYPSKYSYIFIWTKSTYSRRISQLGDPGLSNIFWLACELLIDTGLWPLAVEECNLAFEVWD